MPLHLPAPCRSSFRHLRRFAHLDGTHTRPNYRMVFLLATDLDGNGQIVLLAFALVPAEDTEWWTWFLCFLKRVFPELDKEEFVFISDRDKGLDKGPADGITSQSPSTYHAICCYHLGQKNKSKIQSKADSFALASCPSPHRSLVLAN